MLVSGGTGSMRMEMERMRVMQQQQVGASSSPAGGIMACSSTITLGLTLESAGGRGAGGYGGGGGGGLPPMRRQSPPVQLELLPMRSSHSSETCTPAPSSVTNPFSWQMLASRTNSGSGGYDDGEVETYSSGAVGVSATRDIDMNQLPSTTDCEEEEEGEADDVVVSSSPMISSSTCMKREREPKLHVFDLEQQAAADHRVLLAAGSCHELSSRGEGAAAAVAAAGSDDEEYGGSATTRKKLRLSKEQSALLEESFKDHSTLNPKQKNALAKQLNLRPRQVEVWFQNRRARTKLKQTEVDCEVLKRCCENLTEENRRLQKELQELRALKLAIAATAAAPSPACAAAVFGGAHNFYMPALPAAATLTMCPSCERVAAVEKRSALHVAAAFSTKPAGCSGNSFSHFLQPSAAC